MSSSTATATKAPMPGPVIDSETPSIGGHVLVNGKDDAISAKWYRVDRYGEYERAFGHDGHYAQVFALMFEAGELVFDLPSKQAKCALDFAYLRNARIIRKVNKRIAEYNAANPDKKPVQPHSVDAETAEIEAKRPEMEAFARSIGYDFSKYVNETNDDADVKDCTDGTAFGLKFNFVDQLDRLETATDNIRLMKDVDGVWWYLMIERAFGPHRATQACAGGFGDPKKDGKQESFKETGDREFDEEVSTNVFDAREGITITILAEGEFQPVLHKLSDARARLAIHGIMVSCVWKVYIFTKSS